MTTNTIEDFQGSDIIDVRDIIQRVESLREELQDAMDENEEGHNFEELSEYVDACVKDADAVHAHKLHEEAIELQKLESLLSDLCGYGGDEQWEGDWYPVTLINRSYFVEYCKELVQDIGDLPRDIPVYLEIDWDKTADNLEIDYSTVDFEGEEYLYR